MPVRRALVDCAVLSLQDACVFYPCCKGCFSKIELHQQDTTRCRCSRCGYSCLREQVDHRYRLSIWVARDSYIFGVTVFGTCLNPFFGIPASGLQRLVEDVGEPIETPTRSPLLVKAVEDCFIGRHFIFGLKVTDAGSEPWRGRPTPAGSIGNDAVQFIASQMILPKAACLAGCTVISYFRMLLQKAAECEQGSTDSWETTRAPPTTLLLTPHHSPASSFADASLPASGHLFRSLQRLQNHDCILSPTPPWQQSLGLVTSSAEQEEGCGTQDSGDESSRQKDNTAPRHAEGGCLEKHELMKERAPSSFLCVESRSCSSDLFNKYPDSVTCGKADANAPILDNWSSPSPPGNRTSSLSARMDGFSETSLSGPLALDDLPFSESLAEFLCDENKDFDRVSETEPHLNVQNQRETTRNNLTVRQSQNKNLSNESVSVYQYNSQLTHSGWHRRELVDITNTTHQTYKNPAGYADQSPCNQEDEEAGSLSFEQCKAEDECYEEDVYDCSADLFSSSAMADTNTKTLSVDAETGRRTSNTHRNGQQMQRLMSESDVNMVRFENSSTRVSSSTTSDKHGLNNKKCIDTDSCDVLLTPDKQDLNSDELATVDLIQRDYSQPLHFIPPCQSTPLVKEAHITGSSAPTHRTFKFSSQPNRLDSFSINLRRQDSRNSAKVTSPLCKLDGFSVNESQRCSRDCAEENMQCVTTPERRSPRFAPNRRFRKPNEHKRCMVAQRGQAGIKGSTGRTNPSFDSSAFDGTVCDCEDNEIIVTPTTNKTRLPMSGRRRQNFGSILAGQKAHGLNCKRTLLDHTALSLPADLAQRGNTALSQSCAINTAVDEGSPDGSVSDDDSEACDWSRDLFSDSV